jgi:hypothetical protein
VEAYQQFCELDISLQSLQRNNDKDKWLYIWGNGGHYAAKAYRHLLGFQPIQPSFRWLWNTSCQQKYKEHEGVLRRKNMYLQSYTCELCLLQKQENLGISSCAALLLRTVGSSYECMYQHGFSHNDLETLRDS